MTDLLNIESWVGDSVYPDGDMITAVFQRNMQG